VSVRVDVTQAQRLEPTFNDFVTLLRRRLAGTVVTTEDSVRYTCFAALMRQGFEPEKIILEHPVPASGRERLDSVILGVDGV
jgi:hypothetical protein